MRSMYRYLLLGAFAFVLAACPTPNSTPTTDTASLQKMVLEAEVAYEVPLMFAIAYNKRPRCTVPRTIITCSDEGVVLTLRKINHEIVLGLDNAMKIASTPGVSRSAVIAAVAVATNLIPQLQAILDSNK